VCSRNIFAPKRQEPTPRRPQQKKKKKEKKKKKKKKIGRHQWLAAAETQITKVPIPARFAPFVKGKQFGPRNRAPATLNQKIGTQRFQFAKLVVYW